MTKSTCDLCDAYEGIIQIAEPVFDSYGGRSVFSGEISTIQCPEDNSLVRERVASPGHGKVLVIDGFGSRRRSLLGDQLAEKAVANGWHGIIVYGAVRDVEALEKLDLGVLALAAIPLKTEKKGAGQRDLTLRFAGATFTPGHYVYADLNGLIVAPRALD